jgi:hypothetical protein
MKKMLMRAAFGAAAWLIVTGTAGAADLLQVKVPFPFMVHGRTFPAGQYTVEREDFARSVFLIRGEGGNKIGTFVATKPAESAHPSDMPSLQFKRHENEYRLDSIWESADDGQAVVN